VAKKKTSKTPPPTPAADRPEDARPPAGGHAVLVMVATLFSAALVAAAAFLPDVRLWSINHMAFLPLPVRVALLAVVALAFIPPVARWLYRAALAAAGRWAGLRQRNNALTVLTTIALAATVAFYQLHTATNLLGDGQLIVQSFEAADEGHDQVIMRSAYAIVTEENIAPGATLLYYGAIKTLKPFKRTLLDSMRILNCVLGGLFVFPAQILPKWIWIIYSLHTIFLFFHCILLSASKYFN
jgi:hypothetical protein